MLKRSRGVESKEQDAGRTSHSGLGTLTTAETWPAVIPDREWALYRQALAAARDSGVQFTIGGGFALAFYTGRWRNTKDIDLYVIRGDRERLIAALNKAGFGDYYEQRPYDRGWIYRSVQDGVIVDVIFAMANRRTEVHPVWLERAPRVTLREETFQILSAEELLWAKLYVLQRDHSDWPDLLNLIYATGPRLDWDHLLGRLGADAQLLKALLELFTWLAPNRAAELPHNLRRELQLSSPPRIAPEEEQRRVRLLDSRAWFAAYHPKDQPVEI